MEQSLSLFLSFRLEDPSCAFGAALLQGPTHGAESLSFPFIPLRGSILRLWRTPFSKGLLMEQSLSLFLLYRFEDPSCAFGAALLQGPTHGAESLSFPFIPPRGFILRLWRGPSPRAYSWSGVSLFSFYTASRNPSCAFGAVLFQGPTHGAELSLFLSFCFEDPSCAFGAALLQGPTHGADSLSFPFIPPRGIHPAPLARPFSKGLLMERIHSPFLLYRFEESILRLWRALSSRGYSISKTPFFHLNPSHQSLVTSHQKRKRASLR